MFLVPFPLTTAAACSVSASPSLQTAELTGRASLLGPCPSRRDTQVSSDPDIPWFVSSGPGVFWSLLQPLSSGPGDAVSAGWSPAVRKAPPRQRFLWLPGGFQRRALHRQRVRSERRYQREGDLYVGPSLCRRRGLLLARGLVLGHGVAPSPGARAVWTCCGDGGSPWGRAAHLPQRCRLVLVLGTGRDSFPGFWSSFQLVPWGPPPQVTPLPVSVGM